MAKNDKELGEWKGTTVIGNNVYIKRFKHGITIKKKGELITEKIRFDRETTYKDMTDVINNYYKNSVSNNKARK